MAALNVLDKAECGKINISTRTFFVVFDIAGAAAIGKTQAAIINPGNIFPVSGTGRPPGFTVIQSSYITISPTYDTAQITSRLNMALTEKLQGSVNVAITQFAVKTNHGSGILTGMKMDRTIQNNKAGDVADIKIYQDVNGDGVLQAGTTDQLVSFPLAQTYPRSILAGAGLSSSETGFLEVGDFAAFKGMSIQKPDEEQHLPPLAPGRLVLGDDQTDSALKEVIYYSGYDEDNRRFTGLTRGADGTSAKAWPAGAAVSGQARVRIRGGASEILRGLPGAELTPVERKYIVAFDLDNLASVGSQVRLGFEMRTTDYFKMAYPDEFSPINVGVDPNLTNGFIQKIDEFPDQVYVAPQDINASGYDLQQGATNLTFVTFAMNAEQSDALWRGIVIKATGTATTDTRVRDEIDRISVYKDVNNSYRLDAGDIMLASSAFNTGGGELMAKLNFNLSTSAVQRLLSVPSRYLIAVDMNHTAVPTDPFTNEVRRVGLVLDTESFPVITDGRDTPNDDSISEPNKRPQSFSFTSALHDIVPKPQVLTVVSEPVFTDLNADTAKAMVLEADVPAANSGDKETSWLVSTTQGLPGQGYVMVDNEIVVYTSTRSNALVGITRGDIGSPAVAHSAGAVIGGELKQGQKNRSVLRLYMSASDYEIQVKQMKFQRWRPEPLRGADSDVSRVKIFKDANGDGILNLDAGGDPVADVLVGSSVFTGSYANVDLHEEGRAYALIRKTLSPATFFVTLDIDPTAVFSGPGTTNLNEVTGLELAGAGVNPSSILTGPVNHTVVLANRVASPGFVVMPTVDALKLYVGNMATGLAYQNEETVPILKLVMQADANTAKLESLRVDRIGSGVDSDISNVKMWKDANNNNELFDDTYTVSGIYPNLVSAGNDFLNDGYSIMQFNPPLIIGTAPVQYFITVDISEFGQKDKTIGLSAAGTNYFNVAVPDTKYADTGVFPVESSLDTISETQSIITMGVYDLASKIGTVSQGQKKVSILRFNFTTNLAQGLWRKLLVEKIGSSADVNYPNGRNKDVRFIRIYRDINTNDVLDAMDLPVSDKSAVLAMNLSSAAAAPFNLIVNSTAGFPASGNLLLAGVEVLKYDYISGASPAFHITARSMIMGDAKTPALSISSGAAVEKVDLFNQTDDNDRSRLVELTVPQIVSPVPQTYFIVYDMGESAVTGNGVGVKIAGPNSIVVDAPPDIVNGKVYLNVSQIPQLPYGQLGSDNKPIMQDLPYESNKVVVAGTVLQVSGLNLAPATVEPGKRIALLKIDFMTNISAVDIGAIKFKQTGNVFCQDASACDLTRLELYLESDGNGAFSSGDKPAGSVLQKLQPGGSSDFDIGIATINVSIDGLPKLNVSTSKTTIYLVGTVGASNLIIGHDLGVKLENFSDMKALGGLKELSAIADPVKQPPVSSLNTRIAPLVISAVSISSSMIPVITTYAGPGVPSNAVGYPAYAKVSSSLCNNGRDTSYPRNNVCRDMNGNPVPDQSKWLCADGSSWLANANDCKSFPPLIDINGDGIPDNFSYGASPLTSMATLAGDGSPSRDMTRTGLLDMDLNQDGIADLVFYNADSLQILLGNDLADQGNPLKAVPVSEQGFVPSAWADKSGQLAAMMPVAGLEGYYEVAVTKFYDDEFPYYSGKWSTVAVASTAGLTSQKFERIAAGAPISISRVTGLNLPVPQITKLTANLTPDTTYFTVEDASKLPLPGLVYVGSEIMRVYKGEGNTLVLTGQTGDPAPGNGRGLRGSAPIYHLSGEPVSDSAAIFLARFVTSAGVKSSVKPMFIYRVDSSAPEINLSAAGTSISPVEAVPGQINVPLLKLVLNTSASAVNISKMRIKQTGAAEAGGSAGIGDFAKLKVWLDNGDGVIVPGTDLLLGTTASFAGSYAVVELGRNADPYLRVSASALPLIISADIGSGNDAAGSPILGHKAGVSLPAFTEFIGPNDISLPAGSASANSWPMRSNTLNIVPVTIPLVSLSISSSVAVPVIMTVAGAGIPANAVGYPAFAVVDAANCNNGFSVLYSRNNICRDSSGNPIPDMSKWICADGSQWTANCMSEPPLLDINGDGIPDNFSSGDDSRLTKISLGGDSVPSPSLDPNPGNKLIFDMDFNKDGILDYVLVSNNNLRIELGMDAADPSKTMPMPGEGFVPSAWTGSGQQLKVTLPSVVSADGYYEVAAGRYYDAPVSISGIWSRVEASAAAAGRLKAKSFKAKAAGSPVTAVAIKNLSLPVPNITKLSNSLTPDATVFAVADASKLPPSGIVYVGSEIIRVKKEGNLLTALPQMDVSNTVMIDNGRGVQGSAAINHLAGELVSDDAAIVFSRFVAAAGTSAVRAMFVFRFDPNAPTNPGIPKPQVKSGDETTSFEIIWDPSIQAISGVSYYEMQERGGAPEDLQANVVWRSLPFVRSSIKPSYFIGNPSFPGESPRGKGQFFTYRIRSMSSAGVFSGWTTLESPVATGLSASVLSGVSNYPNPFDPRKSGIESRTVITYTLGDNAEVTITIYDLLGYAVKEFKFSSGGEGGRRGANFVIWDGTNGLGNKVSKGGYIAKIKVNASGGSATAIRKIGVIH